MKAIRLITAIALVFISGCYLPKSINGPAEVQLLYMIVEKCPEGASMVGDKVYCRKSNNAVAVFKGENVLEVRPVKLKAK